MPANNGVFVGCNRLAYQLAVYPMFGGVALHGDCYGVILAVGIRVFRGGVHRIIKAVISARYSAYHLAHVRRVG